MKRLLLQVWLCLTYISTTESRPSFVEIRKASPLSENIVDVTKKSSGDANIDKKNEEGLLDMDKWGPLLEDIELLSGILADVVQSENPRVHDLYTQLREYGLERASALSDCNDETDGMEALGKMISLAKQLNAKEAYGVMRTFAMALNLVNAAEVRHGVRSMKNRIGNQDPNEVFGPLPMVSSHLQQVTMRITSFLL